MKKFRLLCYYLCLIGFFIIVFCSFVYDNNVFYQNNKLVVFFLMPFVILFWFWLYKRKLRFPLWLYFLLVLAIDFLVMYFLRVTPSWDFGTIFYSARSYVLHEIVDASYFEYCPNNIMLYLVLIMLFKFSSLFTSHYLLVAILFNAMMILLSLYLLYKVAKMLYGNDASSFVLVLTFFFIPIFLYVVIVYTDTVTMVFPLLYIYLFLKDKEKGGYRYLLLFGLFAFLGFCLKMSCLIMVIAILLHLFLSKDFKRLGKYFVSVCFSFLVCYFVYFNVFLSNPKYHFLDNNVGSLPFTHYIMMGLESPNYAGSRNSYGGYNSLDEDYTKSFSKDERIKANLAEIDRRLSLYTPLSLANYLGKKIGNTWGDGSFYASVKLTLKSVNRNNLLFDIFVCDGKYFKYYYNAASAVMYAMLFLILVSFIKQRGKLGNSYLYTSIFGLFLFLVIWETRSRYLVNYIPIFLLAIMPCFTIQDEKNGL